MIYFVYILYSKSINKFYKGQTSDMRERLRRHNQRREVFTSKGVPWLLVWKAKLETRDEAIILEQKLKNMSRQKLIQFTKRYGDGIVGREELLLLEQLSK